MVSLYRAYCPVMLLCLCVLTQFIDEPIVEISLRLIYSTLVGPHIFAYGVFYAFHIYTKASKASLFLHSNFLCAAICSRDRNNENVQYMGN